MTDARRAKLKEARIQGFTVWRSGIIRCETLREMTNSCVLDPEEARTHQPKIIVLGEKNEVPPAENVVSEGSSLCQPRVTWGACSWERQGSVGILPAPRWASQVEAESDYPRTLLLSHANSHPSATWAREQARRLFYLSARSHHAEAKAGAFAYVRLNV